MELLMTLSALFYGREKYFSFLYFNAVIISAFSSLSFLIPVILEIREMNVCCFYRKWNFDWIMYVKCSDFSGNSALYKNILSPT